MDFLVCHAKSQLVLATKSPFSVVFFGEQSFVDQFVAESNKSKSLSN